MSYPVCCLTCKNFSIDFGSRGYSELTPGSEASVSCEQSGEKGCAWPDEECSADASQRSFISIAKSCAFFVPHPDIFAETGR